MLKRVRVAGPSMMPTLREDQRLLVWTWAYRRRDPKPGDVVVVEHPSRSLKLVKRVVAVPGDTYAGRTLGADEFLVRGDNRNATTDGLHFGAIGRNRFVGRVILSYRPLRRVR